MTTKENAEKYGINTNKIVAMGHSLGAATTLSTVLGGSLDNLGGCGFDDGLDLDLSEPYDQVDLDGMGNQGRIPDKKPKNRA